MSGAFVNIQETCDTLIAILLLDSISLSETLTLFLTQRSKALRTMFAKLAPLSSSPPLRSRPPSPFSIDRYQNQEITESILRPLSVSPSQRHAGGENSRESRRRRKDAIALVRDMLNQSLDLIVGTVETVRAIYGYEGTKSPPLVEQLLETVQSPSLKQPRLSRHRSRLSIISSFHATPSPIPPSSQSLSTISILESLPSSQLLVQFLPPSITSYSPYIDTTSSASQLSRSYATNSCASWFNGSLSSLEGKLRGWFENLKTVQEVWEARSVIDIYRDRMSASEVAAVVSLMDEVCKGRAKSICQTSLWAIERQLSGLLTSVINGIRSNDKAIPGGFKHGARRIPRLTITSVS
jgi:conserved oligomeric Golgi complex subunit 1